MHITITKYNSITIFDSLTHTHEFVVDFYQPSSVK